MEDDKKAGTGAPSRPIGLGCGSDDLVFEEVLRFLASGSPRLALCVARGIRLTPWFLNLKTQFDDSSVSIQPDVGADQQIIQDTYIDRVVARVLNGQPSGAPLGPVGDFFNNYQSGIEARLRVTGRPAYGVAEEFTDLSTFTDIFPGPIWCPRWILTNQNQLQADFQPTITLTSFPTIVKITLRAWVPIVDDFVQMTTPDALKGLEDLGYDVSLYQKTGCR